MKSTQGGGRHRAQVRNRDVSSTFIAFSPAPSQNPVGIARKSRRSTFSTTNFSFPLSLFFSFAVMVNETNTGEGDLIFSRASVPPLRNYRAALAGGEQQDLATKILKDHVAHTYGVPCSQLSPSDISERKLRAERGALTPLECKERAELEQGSVPIALWSSADWALFSQAEISWIGNKQFME
jgi:hypothetical protein